MIVIQIHLWDTLQSALLPLTRKSVWLGVEGRQVWTNLVILGQVKRNSSAHVTGAQLEAASERNRVHSAFCCTLQPHFNSHLPVTQPAGFGWVQVARDKCVWLRLFIENSVNCFSLYFCRMRMFLKSKCLYK